MIRPFTCVCMVLALGSGLYLYQEKHRAQLLDRQIESTIQARDAAQARTGVLRAEWTLENDPERLATLAEHFLALKPVTPGQFTTMAELDKRLPPVRAPEAKGEDTTEDGTPVAAAPEPEPPRAAAAATPQARPEPPKPEAPRPEPPKHEVAATVPPPAPRPAPPVRVATAAPRAPERRATPFVSPGRVAAAETRSALTPVAAPRPLPPPYLAPTPAPVVQSVLGISRTGIAPPVPFAPVNVSNGGG